MTTPRGPSVPTQDQERGYGAGSQEIPRSHKDCDSVASHQTRPEKGWLGREGVLVRSSTCCATPNFEFETDQCPN